MRKVFFVSALVGLMAMSGCSVENEQGVDQVDNEVSEPMAGNGFIEGGLSYPSERIPDNLRVCTEDETGSSCTTYERLEGDEFKYGVGYRVEVPAGTYKVFSKTDVGGFEPVIGGYTECGDANDCENRQLLLVEVVEGETVDGIDLEDFQAEFY